LAYNNRGLSRRDEGDLDGAEIDFAEARRLEKRSSPATIDR
jgi:hypothetical protein